MHLFQLTTSAKWVISFLLLAIFLNYRTIWFNFDAIPLCSPANYAVAAIEQPVKKVSNSSRDLATDVQRIIVFRGEAVAVPVQLNTISASHTHSIDETQSLEYTLSEYIDVVGSSGETVPGQLRWIHIQAQDASHKLNTRNPDDKTQFIWTETGFPTVEVDSSNADPSTDIAFLVIQDSTLFQSQQIVIGDALVSLVMLDPPRDIQAYSSSKYLPGNHWSQPDPNDPIGMFRRMLLAATEGIPTTTAQPGTRLTQDAALASNARDLPDILARQELLRWLYGLEKLHDISPGVADAVIDVLTRRCTDQESSLLFASWVTSSDQISLLYSLLLSDIRPNHETDWASKILAWVDAQPSFIAWLERAHGTDVQIAIANLKPIPIEFELFWDQNQIATLSHQRNNIDAQNKITIPPSEIMRLQIARPNTQPHPRFLTIQSNQRDNISLAIDTPVIDIAPPGLEFGFFIEAWNLENWLIQQHKDNRTVAAIAEAGDGTAETGIRRAIHPPVPTLVTLRRYEDQWELLIECLHPDNDLPRNTLQSTPRFLSEMTGRNAVTLYVDVSSSNHSAEILSITPDGKIYCWDESGTIRNAYSNLPEIRMLPDAYPTPGSWTVRVLIPEHWTNNRYIDLGFMRTVPDRQAMYCFPYPVLPWILDPGRVRVNLLGWSSFPVDSDVRGSIESK